MEDNGIIDTIQDSFLGLVDKTIDFLPSMLASLLLVLVGFILAKVLSKWVGRLVNMAENSKPVKSGLKSIGAKPVDIDKLVELFTKWTILIIFLSAAVDVLGLAVLTDTFDSLVSFVPKVLATVVVAGLVFIAGNILYDIVHESAKKANIKSYRTLANFAKIAVLVFGLPLAATQLGLDLTIITNNLTVIVAGVMLAFAIAFGMGGRETAGKIVDNIYKNWKK